MASETAQRVIEAIRANRVHFEAFCYSLSEEQLNRPVPQSTWIVRDFAAHLGTLDTELMRWFGSAAGEAMPDSGAGADGTRFDMDAFNDAAVAERRSWPLERIFAEAATNRVALIDTIAGLTEEQVNRTTRFAGDGKRQGGELPLNLFLAGWAQHDPIHVADMLRGLPELADDAELKAWLDSPFVAGYQKVMNR